MAWPLLATRLCAYRVVRVGYFSCIYGFSTRPLCKDVTCFCWMRYAIQYRSIYFFAFTFVRLVRHCSLLFSIVTISDSIIYICSLYRTLHTDARILHIHCMLFISIVSCVRAIFYTTATEKITSHTTTVKMFSLFKFICQRTLNDDGTVAAI